MFADSFSYVSEHIGAFETFNDRLLSRFCMHNSQASSSIVSYRIVCHTVHPKEHLYWVLHYITCICHAHSGQPARHLKFTENCHQFLRFQLLYFITLVTKICTNCRLDHSTSRIASTFHYIIPTSWMCLRARVYRSVFRFMRFLCHTFGLL